MLDFPALDPVRDWPWWRGPTRNGVAGADAKPPVRFGDSENVVWRTPVPGRGHSSPIVVGERVFLTTADEAAQIHSVLAFDRATGRQLWQTEVSRGGFPARIHGNNTHATPTIACDGKQLIAVFIRNEAIEATWLDLEGKQLRQAVIGPFHPKQYEFGYGPSPLLFKNMCIFASEFDGASFLAAVDIASGQDVWRTSRPKNISFSSPVVAPIAGRDQLLISGAHALASYDPNTGSELWSAKATTAATCGTVVWHDDIIMASGGYPDSVTCAVRGDGSGNVLWQNKEKCYEQSMIEHEGSLYALTDKGVMYCWNAADGTERWKQRLRGPVSSSPVLADGRIYWANERGTYYVVRATPETFDLLAENQVGDESFASPAAVGDRLFLRIASSASDSRQEYLVCVGDKK
ncbi:MAG: dehydrogenase [Pirellula sp.]|nr:dehydrogenase [Pirellula sp.]